MPGDNTSTVEIQVCKNGCSGGTLQAPCTKKEEAAEKDDYRQLLDR